MRVKLLHDTFVKFETGATLEVTEEEGKRLVAFALAREEKPKEKKKKKGE